MGVLVMGDKTADVIRKADEKFLQMHMDSCKSFTGLQHKTCQRGIAYDDVRQGKSISCFKGKHIFSPNDICKHRDFPTLGESEAYLKECQERTHAMLDGLCPDCGTELIDDTIKEGRHVGHGSLVCPKCEAVKVWI